MSTTREGWFARRARRRRLPCAMSEAGEKFEGGLGFRAALLIPTMAAGFVAIEIWGEHSWKTFATPGLVIAAYLVFLLRYFVAAKRGIAAERDWVAKLPFVVDNYEQIAGDEPVKRLEGYAHVDFATALDDAARVEVEQQLANEIVTWTYDPETRRFSYLGHLEEADLGTRRRWLHACLERMRAIHHQRTFTTVVLIGS